MTIENNTLPKRVIAAKVVDLVLMTYVDERGIERTQLALAGDTKVHLLESRALGISSGTTPQGAAPSWLAQGVLEKIRPSETKKERK